VHLFLYVSRSLVILWALSATSLPGCARRAYQVESVGEASAKGDVELHDWEGGNRLVVVTFDELPPPEAHGAQYRHYVVWLRPMGRGVLNAGRLAYDETIGVGAMRLVTPHESFELVVTVEPDAGVSAPGPRVVARRIVQRAR